MHRKLAGTLLAVLFTASPVFAATYQIDRDHSTVGFKIRHLLSYVRGTFGEFEGKLEYEPGKPENWSAEAVIQAASIDTHVKQRDEHLRSGDFFDAAKYPALTFKSTKVTDATETTAKLHGVLSLHGVEKPVVLDVEIHGVADDPWGNTRAGFTAVAKINRKDFGLAWNQVLEKGQLLVGEEVEITLEVEGLLQK